VDEPLTRIGFGIDFVKDAVCLPGTVIGARLGHQVNRDLPGGIVENHWVSPDHVSEAEAIPGAKTRGSHDRGAGHF
jgi:hypothetical protein